MNVSLRRLRKTGFHCAGDWPVRGRFVCSSTGNSFIGGSRRFLRQKPASGRRRDCRPATDPPAKLSHVEGVIVDQEDGVRRLRVKRPDRFARAPSANTADCPDTKMFADDAGIVPDARGREARIACTIVYHLPRARAGAPAG